MDTHDPKAKRSPDSLAGEHRIPTSIIAHRGDLPRANRYEPFHDDQEGQARTDLDPLPADALRASWERVRGRKHPSLLVAALVGVWRLLLVVAALGLLMWGAWCAGYERGHAAGFLDAVGR